MVLLLILDSKQVTYLQPEERSMLCLILLLAPNLNSVILQIYVPVSDRNGSCVFWSPVKRLSADYVGPIAAILK